MILVVFTLEGNHVYVVAPLAVNVTVVPAQTELAVLAMLMVGIEFTESVSTAEPVQVPIAPLTVYVLVEVGLTVGFTELELLLQV